jgi:hypothetical protein
MTIRRRVTARYNSRARMRPSPGVTPSVQHREETDAQDLPASPELAPPEPPSVRAAVPLEPPVVDAPSEDVAPMSFSAYVRDARDRAERIVRQHPARDGGFEAVCQPCVVAYPCDAVRAARDVLAISDALTLDEPVSRASIVELFSDLLDVRAPLTRASAPGLNAHLRPPRPNPDYRQRTGDRNGGGGASERPRSSRFWT